MSRLLGIFRVSLIAFCCMPALLACSEQLFHTRFSTIHYAQDKELSDLVWRISGRTIDGKGDTDMVRSRVDEIVERVEGLLGMYPNALHVDLYLEPKYLGGDIAQYSRDKKCITVAVDRVTDGVLAHEIAHAVINSYFQVPPPKKVQEILAQYVDRQLWSE